MSARATLVPWSTSEDVARHYGISIRHFHRLKRLWIHEQRMREGKHFRRFGPRTIRYNLMEMDRLAHSRGRIVPQSWEE